MSKTYIKDIRVQAQVVLGETDLKVKEIAALGEGSIIALKSLAGEPVDLVVAGEKIAKGEVVVIDENFGLRVTKIINGEE